MKKDREITVNVKINIRVDEHDARVCSTLCDHFSTGECVFFNKKLSWFSMDDGPHNNGNEYYRCRQCCNAGLL